MSQKASPLKRPSLKTVNLDVFKLNEQAHQRVKQAFTRGPTHAGQFQFYGTAFQILARDVKFYGLMLWCGFWLALRYGGVLDSLTMPASLIR